MGVVHHSAPLQDPAMLALTLSEHGGNLAMAWRFKEELSVMYMDESNSRLSLAMPWAESRHESLSESVVPLNRHFDAMHPWQLNGRQGRVMSRT